MNGWPGAPLLGAAGRLRAAALLVGSVVVVAVLSVLVAHQVAADGFDRTVDSPVIGWLGGYRGFLAWMAFPGTPVPAAAASVALAAACLWTRRLNGAILAALAVPVSTGLDEKLLKPAIHRTYLGALSFPSGHATTVVALTATVAVLYFIPPQPPGARVIRAATLTVTLSACCAVVLAVIALRWHYFTDTVAGAAVGFGTVCGISLALDLRPVRRLGISVCRRVGGEVAVGFIR